MRHLMTAMLLVAGFAGLQSTAPVAATDHRDLPVREEIRKTVALAPNAHVEVRRIAGPVEVVTSDGTTAEISIVRSAQTQQDLDCYRVVVGATPERLEIYTEQSCTNVRDRQRVTLSVPRGVSLTLSMIAGDVRVGALDGVLRLDSIAGTATVASVRAAHLSSLANGLDLGVDRVDAGKVSVSNVRGDVRLAVGRAVDADVTVENIMGSVTSEAPGVTILESEGVYRARLGSGGGSISLSNITGNVTIDGR